MARDFTGANTTTRLDRTLGTGLWSGATNGFSIGCWCNMDTWVAARTFIGVGTTDASMTGLLTGASTAQRFRLKKDNTTDAVVEVAAPATGAWICVVATAAFSSAEDNDNIYTGSLTSPMAVQSKVVATDGSGGGTNSTAGTIGKNAGAGTAIDGRIAQAFILPWQMTLGEIEQFRQGDWSVLWRGGQPIAFVPMTVGTAATYDLAQRANWTVTSTPTVSADPPIAAGWGNPQAMVADARPAVETPQDVGDGSITPTGEPEQLILKNPAGAITPAGALTSNKIYTLTLTGNA